MILTEKIISVLNDEHQVGLITGTMAEKVAVPGCEGVGHCALGALLFASGVNNKRLGDWGDLTAWYGLLKFDYGLDQTDTDKLMHFNDDCVHFSVHTGENWKEAEVRCRTQRLNTVVEFIRNGLQDENEGNV